MLAILQEAAAKTVSEASTTAEEFLSFDIHDITEKIGEEMMALAPSILGALAILVLGYIGAKIVAAVLRRVLVRAKLDPTVAVFASKIAHFALLGFVLIAAIGEVGVDTGSFIAIIGAAGLALGFALQGSLSNFAAGVLLIVFRPFRIGDVVEIGGVIGTVREIEFFATTIVRGDNKRVIVPNSSITGGNITNFTVEGKLRVDLKVGISYDSDIKKAKEVLMKLCLEHPKVLKDPAPLVAVLELADSSINLVVRPWCKPTEFWDVHFEVMELIKSELDKADIVIPFPQRDVHLHQVA